MAALWEENRAGVPGLGVYHSRTDCAFCGDWKGPLLVVVIRSTMARGLVCENTIACVRRQHEAKQMRLFGSQPERSPVRAAEIGRALTVTPGGQADPPVRGSSKSASTRPPASPDSSTRRDRK